MINLFILKKSTLIKNMAQQILLEHFKFCCFTPVNCLDRGISLKNRNLCYQKIFCDSF